jgi:hypothetical protein
MINLVRLVLTNFLGPKCAPFVQLELIETVHIKSNKSWTSYGSLYMQLIEAFHSILTKEKNLVLA